MMAILRQRRSFIIFSLPLLGFALVFLGMYPSETIEYGNLALSSSRNLIASAEWGLLADNDQVMLLRPEEDESKRFKVDHLDNVDMVLSQGEYPTETQQRRPETGLLKLMNPGESLDSDSNAAGSTTDPKKMSVRRDETAQRDLENSQEDLEKEFFHAFKPGPQVTPPRLNTNKIHVLIVTNRRSGSSFLGQFFNQHPNLFFQFEPLKLPEQKKTLYPDPVEFLWHLARCEFDRTPHLTEFYDSEPLHRSSSRTMVIPPLCNVKSSQPITQKTIKECQKMEVKPLMQVCQSKQYQAMKLIRLGSLATLKPLANDPEINLKIIHLVRDPRGTHISKSKVPSRTKVSLELGASLDRDISYLCRRIKRNLDFVQTLPPWLRGKYKLVRFEDIAYHPEKLAQEIYDFTGMGPLPKEVLDWIQENTNKPIVKSKRKSNEFYYSTSRNASQVSEAWRFGVSIDVVLRMQEFCKNTLNDLGYLEVKTEQELLDKGRSLIAELPKRIPT